MCTTQKLLEDIHFDREKMMLYCQLDVHKVMKNAGNGKYVNTCKRKFFVTFKSYQ